MWRISLGSSGNHYHQLRAGDLRCRCGDHRSPIDQLAGQLDRFLNLLERGGPALVALELMLGVAFLAALGAVLAALRAMADVEVDHASAA